MAREKNFKELNNTFDIDSPTVDNKVLDTIPMMPDDSNKIELSSDIKSDYEYSRSTLNNVIGKGMEAIDGILELAQETDSPRAYEVVGQLIKTVTDSSEKLMEIQKRLRDLEQGNKSNIVTNNSLMVGTTNEVLAMLKKELKIKPSKTINKEE